MRLALFGAPPDTTNMGVSALYISAVTGISQHIENVEFVVFDYGFGRRDTTLVTPGGITIPLILFGARIGHRYYRPENLTTMKCMSRLGKFGAIFNEGIRLIDSCAAVLDVSGGDSFSDIYGRRRFNGIYLRKLITLNRGKPLILLPQTYGPYKRKRLRDISSLIVKHAAMAWARDADSFNVLKGLLGNSFNPQLHLCGVDMAFGLQPISADQKLDSILSSWVNEKDPSHPLVGFNISGLIYNDPEAAISHYGFKAEYRSIVINFLTWLLNNTSARIVLIPHVMDPPGNFESDLGANLDVIEKLDQLAGKRVLVSPLTLNQSQVKWLISHMDWFCGTRMHSTIAGLSSGVPTASISYSDKTKGVFETCGQAQHVFDPRLLDTEQAIHGLVKSFEAREATRNSLHQYLPQVMNTVSSQMESIANLILKLR